jgi:hypothetical protein
MTAETLEKEWGIITGMLPPDWRELARSTGAFRRARQVRDPDTLLLLILLHVAAGLSLVQAAARARRMGITEISAVALHKRLRAAGAWLHALAAGMYERSSFRRPIRGLPWTRRIRVVDATHVREPGSSGTDWRVHYVLQLPSLVCDFFEVTDPSGGETYKRLPVEPGDLILADRGYAHRGGVAHVMDARGDVLVRLNGTNFPLLDEEGNALDLLSRMRTLSSHEPGEWPVRFEDSKRRYSARLCAIRKSAVAAERARTRLLRQARKQGTEPKPETLELSEYVFVLTSLGPEVSTALVLQLYRARWQVELAFKRMKSLFDAGHVPKYDSQSAQAWLHAKLLAVLLMERLGEEARLFSPWGFPLHPA